MNISRIGFLDCVKFDKDASVRGGILVTDLKTKPIEFRVTTLITPTMFQKALYGNILDEHIYTELVAIPVISSLQRRADIIFVNNKLFMETKSAKELTIVRIYKKSSSSIEVLVDIPSDFHLEKEEIINFVKSISEGRDVFEPFERVRIACEHYHKNQKDK